MTPDESTVREVRGRVSSRGGPSELCGAVWGALEWSVSNIVVFLLEHMSVSVSVSLDWSQASGEYTAQ